MVGKVSEMESLCQELDCHIKVQSFLQETLT